MQARVPAVLLSLQGLPAIRVAGLRKTAQTNPSSAVIIASSSLIAVSHLRLHPLIAVSRLDQHPFISVSRLNLHPFTQASRFKKQNPLKAMLRLELHYY